MMPMMRLLTVTLAMIQASAIHNSSSCMHEGQACSAVDDSAKCCPGFVCYEETACVAESLVTQSATKLEADEQCVPESEPCHSDGDCCSGLRCDCVCVVKDLHAKPAACIVEGQPCGDSAKKDMPRECCPETECYEDTACVAVSKGDMFV
eukprot:gnl/TRDRNA2_/TRDRNA2_83071_c0_seq2.p1 gnl/TRDRNA2_/TRDRNA2_83071_c0~~gnl/TRDRNA2_/TRDRNA2_83071_c0_seq2.p1  ORF type:complete len:150 (+),score=18.37 gnl/TRDRNA2_/TRDRNA2_83071_c0_seq2:47-496(+)